MRNLLILGAAAVVAAGLFVALRPDDETEAESSSRQRTAPTTTGTTSTVTMPVVPQPPQPPPPARVRVTVREGLPVGGPRRVTVGRGRRVVLRVVSDVADHVHLHGYDVMRDVAPGRPAEISFRATIVGTVEAELEERGVRIATITATP